MLKLLLLTLTLNSYAYIINRSNFTREVVENKNTITTPHTKLYERWHREINPFISSPYLTMYDKTTDNDNQIIYAQNYHTEDYGLRIIPSARKDLPQHLIVSGDSNVFGVGCADNETLPYFLSREFPEYSVVNFGLGGTAANSQLRFLDIFTLKEMFPVSYKKGIFIYDFHDFHIQRMIGSKSFLEWGDMTPKYALNSNDIPVYSGPWSESWQKKFYSFLNIFPQSDRLFPDLPRIGDRHIDLSARIILALKNKYLEQTSKDNKFIVFINPEGRRIRYPGIISNWPKDDTFSVNKEMAKKLRELKIDVVDFEDEEVLDLPKYRFDGHFMGEAQRNYAKMVAVKIRARN